MSSTDRNILSDRELKGLFENLPVAAFVTDPKRRVLTFNQEARQFSHVGEKIVSKGRTCREIFHCQVADAECPLQKAFAAKIPIYRFEARMRVGERLCTLIERVRPFQDPETKEWKAVVVLGDATEHFKTLRKLRRYAEIDHQTGVLTRSYFEALLTRATRRDRRRRSSAFLMIDVDHLKLVNDTYGHAAGDLILQRLGRILRRVVRRTDLVGRLGGDEFGIYSPNTTRKEAENLRNRVRIAIEKDNALHSDLPRLGVGIGVAFSQGAEGGSHLRTKADSQLYLYKRTRVNKRLPEFYFRSKR